MEQTFKKRATTWLKMRAPAQARQALYRVDRLVQRYGIDAKLFD